MFLVCFFFLSVTSEPDENEIVEARDKVYKWLKGTSGLGSDMKDEDVNPV